MAQLTNTYKAKGVLDTDVMELTETKKEGIEVHDLQEALEMFAGLDVSITITRVHDVAPKEKE